MLRPGRRSIGGSRRTTPGTITHSAAAGCRPLRCQLRAFLGSRGSGSLRSPFRSRHSALAHARGPFLRPHFPLPLSILRIRGYDPRSSRPAQLPCPLRSNHELSLGSWPGLRERRQEARAAADGDVGLPWGSGSGAQWWKGSRQLRATPSARRPQGIPGPLLLLGPWNLGSQARSVAKGGGSRGNTAFLLWASRKDLAFKGPQCPNPSPLRSGEAEPAAHSTPPTQARPALRGCNGTLSLEPTALGSLVKGVPHRTYLGEPPHSLILLQA